VDILQKPPPKENFCWSQQRGGAIQLPVNTGTQFALFRSAAFPPI
jgi:hypothetical protein